MEEKKISPKMSKRLAIIGAIMMIVGIIIIFGGVGQIRAAKVEEDRRWAQYEADRDAWQEKWHNGQASINDSPDMPGFVTSVSGIATCVGGGLATFIGFAILMTGLSPYIMKAGVKLEKETMDYLGDDLAEMGARHMRRMRPIIDEGTDIIATNVSKVTKAVKGKSVTKCPNCGGKLVEEDGKSVCHYCDSTF